MVTSPSNSVCPRCGQTVSSGWIGGLCPRCISRTSLGALLGPTPAARPRLGDYELGEELGRGAMGAVYRARHVPLGQTVALKVILTGEFASEAERRRFLAEAGQAARLDHPNIVRVFNYGETEGRQFYAMELVEGPTLAAAVQSAEWKMKNAAGGAAYSSFRHSAFLISQVARAVQHAHERGVLHRDLKPGNILLDAAGAPHISDFGLAKLLDPAADTAPGTETLAGSPIGTPAYMAPEQVRGDRTVTIAADLWSLGAVLYELLAGRPPFVAGSAVETYRQILEQEPPRIATDRPDRPGPAFRDLEIIALKCLRKAPAQRYASAAALADDLDRWLRKEPIQARTVSAPERLWLWTRRRPLVASLSLALALGGVLGTLLLLRANQRLTRALAETREAERSARTHLHAALVAQVRARRGLNAATPHSDTLKVIAEAARLAPSLDTRNEAVIALAARDRDAGRSNAVPDAVFREFAASGSASLGCSLDVSPDGSLVVVGTHAALQFWDVRSGGLLATRTQSGFPWVSAHFTPDGSNVVFSARNFGVNSRSLDRRENSDGRTLEFGPVVRRSRPFDATVQATYRDKRDWLVALDRNPIYITKVEIWPDGNAEAGRVVAAGDLMTYMSLSPDQRWLASTLLPAADVRIWDTQTAKPVHHLGLKGALLATFTPDGRHLITRDTAEYIVWNVGAWTKVTAWPADTTSLAARIRFSPDGRFLAVLQGNDRIQFVRLADWSEAVTLIGPLPLDVTDMTWNAAGDRFYLVTREGQVREWNLASLRQQLGAMKLNWDPAPAAFRAER
jgi:serine/threonine protein kinase